MSCGAWRRKAQEAVRHHTKPGVLPSLLPQSGWESMITLKLLFMCVGTGERFRLRVSNGRPQWLTSSGNEAHSRQVILDITMLFVRVAERDVLDACPCYHGR